MRKDKLLFTILTAYLLLFALTSFHKSPSGLRKKHFFRRIRERGKIVYKEEGQECDLTPVVTKIFSIKAPSEPGDY